MTKTNDAGRWLELHTDRELIGRLEEALIRLNGSPWSRLEDVVLLLETAVKSGEALDELLRWRAGDDNVYNLEHLENLAFAIQDPFGKDELLGILAPDSLFFFAPRFLSYIRDLAGLAREDQSALMLLRWFIPHEPRQERRGRPTVSFSEKRFRLEMRAIRARARCLASGDEAALRQCERLHPKLHEALRTLHAEASDRDGLVLAITSALWTGQTDSVTDMNAWLESQDAEELRLLLGKADETKTRPRPKRDQN